MEPLCGSCKAFRLFGIGKFFGDVFIKVFLSPQENDNTNSEIDRDAQHLPKSLNGLKSQDGSNKDNGGAGEQGQEQEEEQDHSGAEWGGGSQCCPEGHAHIKSKQ